jgi:hypothetical protein
VADDLFTDHPKYDPESLGLSLGEVLCPEDSSSLSALSDAWCGGS